MIRVALTGGIGAGKSEAAELFAALGAPVLDADRVARELLQAGSPQADKILARYGDRVRAADGAGEIDRARLRALIFADARERVWLEGVLHPVVRRRMAAWCAAQDAPYCVLVIPLLVETGMNDLADLVVAVDCPESVQIERAAARDGAARADIETIVASQASRARRRAAATVVIDNSADRHTLEQQVRALHTRLVARAANA